MHQVNSSLQSAKHQVNLANINDDKFISADLPTY